MIYIIRKHIRNNDVYMRYPTCIALQLRQFFGGEKKETCMESYLLIPTPVAFIVILLFVYCIGMHCLFLNVEDVEEYVLPLKLLPGQADDSRCIQLQAGS